MAGWNQDALRAVGAIKAKLKEASPEEAAALDEVLAAIENDGKPQYSVDERARAHAAIAKVEKLVGPRAREELDNLKGAFDLTLGPESS